MLLPLPDVERLGQVFTPPNIVKRMFALQRNHGRILEPSVGEGAFFKHFTKGIGIEIDAELAKISGAIHQDFFAYPIKEKFDTIIGNPPYVRYQDILAETKVLLPAGFDERSNLYLFFIRKAMDHLNPGGELIFITPREFLKATSAKHLNEALYTQGCITNYEELGDAKIFSGYAPNCSIWRWEAGRKSRVMTDKRKFCYRNGQIWFGANEEEGILGDFFEVKVGAVSGADHIFTDTKNGCTNFVCSKTRRNGETRRMIYNRYDKTLVPHKEELLSRRIRKFDESNWWEWGRRYHHAEGPRIYVNCKTRNPKPFFPSDEVAYDGSVMALFPKNLGENLGTVAEKLNQVDWEGLGFVCDGRLQFTQRALENAPVSAL